MATPEGYATPEGTGYRYVYQYKDHLDNVRLSYTKNGSGNLEIVEESNYYPFGLTHKGYNNIVSPHANSTAQKFKFNGIEHEEVLGLDLYEMPLRQYDPAIARWTSIDPVIHHSNSTYNGFDNNPVYWADPSGASVEQTEDRTTHTGEHAKVAFLNLRKQYAGKNKGNQTGPGKGKKKKQEAVIGIHSNIGENGDFTGGHAWVSVHDKKGKLVNTFGLWPDDHPATPNDPENKKSDVMKDFEKSYTGLSTTYSLYFSLNKEQYKKIIDKIKEKDTWSLTHTCADWARDVIQTGTGERLDVDDYLGAETPRELSKAIINYKKIRPKNIPASYEKQNSTSSFNN